MNSLPFGQLKSFLKILIGVQYQIDPMLLHSKKRPRPKPAPHKQPMPVFLPHGYPRSKSSAKNVPAVLQHIHFLLSHKSEHMITRRFRFVNQHSPAFRTNSAVDKPGLCTPLYTVSTILSTGDIHNTRQNPLCFRKCNVFVIFRYSLVYNRRIFVNIHAKGGDSPSPPMFYSASPRMDFVA